MKEPYQNNLVKKIVSVVLVIFFVGATWSIGQGINRIGDALEKQNLQSEQANEMLLSITRGETP